MIFHIFCSRWEIQRSKCSVECGDGIQQLSYTCIQTFPQTKHRAVVDDIHCPSSQRNKKMEKCYGSCAAATWTYDDYDEVSIWSIRPPCSKIGTQFNTIWTYSLHSVQNPAMVAFNGERWDVRCTNVANQSIANIVNFLKKNHWNVRVIFTSVQNGNSVTSHL